MSVTQKRAHTPTWHPDFCDCCQGTPLYHVALVANGAYMCGSHRIVTNGERVLKQLPPPRAQQEATDPGAPSFCEGGLLAKHHDYSRGAGF